VLKRRAGKRFEAARSTQRARYPPRHRSKPVRAHHNVRAPKTFSDFFSTVSRNRFAKHETVALPPIGNVKSSATPDRRRG
jgi:hypothetical protein